MNLMIHQSIKITTDISLRKVTYFNLQWEVNNHASLIVKGEVEYEDALLYRRQMFSGSRIVIEKDAVPRPQVLFSGLIKDVEIFFEGKTAWIQIQGISASCKLDRVKKSRSFQDTQMVYANLAKKVAYEVDADVIATIGKDDMILVPLIQHKETDWEFLKRISSHLNQFILCDVITGTSAFWFGMRRGVQIELSTDEFSYCSQYNPVRKKHKYTVKSRDVYQIGDRTVFMGAAVTVLSRMAEFKREELIFTYELGDESILSQKIQYNEAIMGSGLSGRVTAISDEKIQIQLDIDGEADTGSYWYPWRPATGNTMYAVPEVGSPVVLSIPEPDERSAYVGICLHKDGAKVNREREYDDRCLKTKEGSQLRLYPGLLEFSRNDGQDSLALSDGSISFNTEKNINMKAKKQIYVQGRKVLIKAADEIDGVVG